jgi:sensor histidine kinase YesM
MAFIEKSNSILDYINSIMLEMPILSEIILCDNYAVNDLLFHYKNLCEIEEIDFECSVNLNSKHAIADKFLCVIFGNCLENALEACRRMNGGQKFIRITAKLNGTNLFITMDNSFDGNVSKSDNGFLSSKRNNKTGIGLSSIKFIAEKYNGNVQFSAEGHIFKSNIFLNLGLNADLYS